MKIKRLCLVVVIIAFSLTCIYFMNDSYDRLARYQYKISEAERKIMLSQMSDDDINYIIQQKIKPELLMSFISLEGFKVKNVLYYEVCSVTQPNDLQYIVNFVNNYKDMLVYETLESIMENYSYTILEEYYNGAYLYVKDSKLISAPNEINTRIKENETLYRYIPTSLISIDNSVIPSVSIFEDEFISIKSDVVDPLKQMCADLGATNGKTCGGLILTSGYVSYDRQVKEYEKAIVTYGFDNFKKYDDYPGQSEKQLGYSITFTISEVASEHIEASDQVKWLNENATKYGFIIRYPIAEEEKTGKVYQPLTLRYIGKETQTKINN